MDDPLAFGGIAGFAQRLRNGDTSAREVTEWYLARIAALNPKLEAFVYVAVEEARAAARGIDVLLAAGIDLGPLMGVPIGIKDLFAVQGMPTRAGSTLDLADRIGAEGSFVQSLKRAGCVVLGKTRTIEFAAGAHNIARPTPWNPCDLTIKRSPGGSSNGSAVAVGAGLCSFAVGSDTGGSVRVPAALCGIFGLKTSTGLWPLGGIFPLSPTLDSVGLLTASAADAAAVYRALEGGGLPSPRTLAGRRFGVVATESLNLDATVCRRYTAALQEIECQGADLVVVDWPTVEERADIAEIFAILVATDLLCTLEPKRYISARSHIDPITCERLDPVMNVRATDYTRLLRRCRELASAGAQRLCGLDALLAPTSPILPRAVADLSELEAGRDFVGEALSISRAANVYDLCAVSLPLPSGAGELPVGLQIACAHDDDAKLLHLALSLEHALGRRPTCDMTSLLGSCAAT